MISFDDKFTKNFIGSGLFVEDQEVSDKNYLKKIESKKILSQVEKAGIEMRKRAWTEVLGNVICNCSAQGVYVHTEGRGHIECNTISKCRGPLVEICGGSTPVLKDNQLEGGVGGAQGIIVYDRARPEIVNNIVKECVKAGVHISDGAMPTGRHSENVPSIEPVYSENARH